MRDDEYAQIHILEMLTLFWLFFMTAAFLITVHVPDEASISVDAEMQFAGEDAINLGPVSYTHLTLPTILLV